MQTIKLGHEIEYMDLTYLSVTAGSLVQAFFSVIACMSCGIPLAHVVSRYEFPGRRFLLASAPLFFIMPSRLAGACIQSLYGFTGLSGIVATHFFLNMPFVFFVMTASYNSLDYTLQLAARDLGARMWRCYKDIIFPYLTPALISTSCIIGILCFSSHTIPRIFGYELYHATPDIMLADAYKNNQYAQSWMYVVIRICVILPISFMRTSNKPTHAYMKRSRQSLSWSNHYLWIFFLIIIVCSMYAPLIALCIKRINQPVLSFWQSVLDGTHDSLLGCSIRHTIATSLCVAFISSCLALGLAILCLFAIHRVTKIPVLNICITMSASMPFLLGGVGCSICCLWIAHHTYASGLLVAIGCHTVFNYPYAYRIIRARYQQYDPQWTWSAMSLGAHRWKAFLTIEVPFMKYALWRALCVTAGLSLVEVGAEGILVNKSVMTMPIALRVYRDYGLDDKVLGMSLITCFFVWLGTYLISCYTEQADG